MSYPPRVFLTSAQASRVQPKYAQTLLSLPSMVVSWFSRLEDSNVSSELAEPRTALQPGRPLLDPCRLGLAAPGWPDRDRVSSGLRCTPAFLTVAAQATEPSPGSMKAPCRHCRRRAAGGRPPTQPPSAIAAWPRSPRRSEADEVRFPGQRSPDHWVVRRCSRRQGGVGSSMKGSPMAVSLV